MAFQLEEGMVVVEELDRESRDCMALELALAYPDFHLIWMSKKTLVGRKRKRVDLGGVG